MDRFVGGPLGPSWSEIFLICFLLWSGPKFQILRWSWSEIARDLSFVVLDGSILVCGSLAGEQASSGTQTALFAHSWTYDLRSLISKDISCQYIRAVD